MTCFIQSADALSQQKLSATKPVNEKENLLTQDQLNNFTQNTEFRFGVLHNFTETAHEPKAHIIINNHSSIALPSGEGDWKIYFHLIRNVSNIEAQGLKLTHIQGDLMELSPTTEFKGLAAQQSLEIVLYLDGGIISSSSFLPRAFMTQSNLQPAIFANTDTENLPSFVEPFTKPEQQLRYAGDQNYYPIATAELRFQNNVAINAVKFDEEKIALGIIPQPKKLVRAKGIATLDASWSLSSAIELSSELNYLQSELKQQSINVSSNKKAKNNFISLQLTQKGAAESYQLIISEHKILIQGRDAAGVFYGIQSLLALLPTTHNLSTPISLPQLTINDAPRFVWRGMHYDMARNFHGKPVLLRMIDQMAHYKLNKLHLHLADDEGWRLEIPGLPELTQVGAHRCFDLTEQQCLLTQLGNGPHSNALGNGYFSTQDFVEILGYAAERHIEVIPEIDMPGHARAAIKSMQARYKKLIATGDKKSAEEYLLAEIGDTSNYSSVQSYNDNAINVCLPSTYVFVEKVMQELQNLYRAAGLKLNAFHMGGDEVGKGAWTKSSACAALFAQGDKNIASVADLKTYFVQQVARITQTHQLALIGWEDGLMLDADHAINPAQLANKNLYTTVWDNIWEGGVAERAYRLANNDYRVVLVPATHLYFDHPQEVSPDARGSYWATRYTDMEKIFKFMPDHYYANADKKNSGEPIKNLESLVNHPLVELKKLENIRGIQGALWSEIIRTPEVLEQMIYPRIMALAERAWHKGDWESEQPNTQLRWQDWALFNQLIVSKTFPRLADAGASFYLPPPGAIFKDNSLQANSNYPGLEIEYSLDEGATWKKYSAPVTMNPQSVLLRTHLGKVVSATTTLN